MKNLKGVAFYIRKEIIEGDSPFLIFLVLILIGYILFFMSYNILSNIFLTCSAILGVAVATIRICIMTFILLKTLCRL
ncbi:MAG TPA: hypothetical protein DIT25_00820 [Candidatus Moranbacteria bacterium]|nr:hypothetical protein [Candidatus Moranbacteria bacterium]